MRRNTLFKALPIVASALGRKYGITVEIGGRDAFTDGTKIVLPSLPSEHEMAALLAYGYLDHEAGHVRLTDFADVQVDLAIASALKHTLWNIFEDIRIEKVMGQMFPGCRTNLDRLTHQLVANGVFRLPDNLEPVSVLHAYLLYTLRSEALRQQALVPLALQSEDLLSQIFSAKLRFQLAVIFGKVRAMKSTRDALSLAEEVVRLFESELQKPQSDGEQGQGASDNPSGNTSQLSSSAESTEKDKPDQNKTRRPSSSFRGSTLTERQGAASGPSNHDQMGNRDEHISASAGTEDGTDNGNSGGPTPSSGTKTQKNSGDDLLDVGDVSQAQARNDQDLNSGTVNDIERDALTRILNATTSDFLPDFGTMLSQQLQELCGETNRHDARNIRVAVVEPSPTGTAAHGKALVDEVRTQTRALRTRLDALVQASRLDRPHVSVHGKRIDTNRLDRLAVSDLRIFSSARPRQSVNTAVQIVLDASSSMKESRIEVARRSALAAALALQSIHGTSVSCVAFGKQRSVTVLTGFGERVEPTAHRYGAIEAEGGTPLAEALWWCASEILGRKETRKILLVITDGEPNDLDTARRIIHKYLDAGIEAIGLGIELTNIRDLFPVSAVIHDLTQLPKALFRLLEKGFTHSQSLRTA